MDNEELMRSGEHAIDVHKDQLLANVGVVVIGRNEGARLQSSLRAVMSTGVPLVYVDSRSTDNSIELARSLGVDVLVLSDDKPINASRARNEGAKTLMARFPGLRYLQFLDGDTALDAGWLIASFRHLEAYPEVGFVCGQLREKNRDDNIYRRLCDMEWSWEATADAEPCHLGGMGMMRLSAFASSGGYDETLIAGADPELYTRLAKQGWALHVLSTAMGTHDSGMQSFWQWWIRNVKTGFGFAHGQATGAWGRERRSTILWGGFLPLITLAAVIILSGWTMLLLLIYPLNVFRIWTSAAKREFSQNDRWLYASACMAMKIPQFIGVIKYYRHNRSTQTASIIQYK